MFSRPSPHLSEMAVGGRSAKKSITSDLITGAISPEQHRDNNLDSEYDDEGSPK